MKVCLRAYYYFVIHSLLALSYFHRYSPGSGDMKHQERLQEHEARGHTPAPRPTMSYPHPDEKINHAHRHTHWDSFKEVAWSYNIISFECFLRFIRQSAIIIPPFSIPPLEKRDNICGTWQNVPNPLNVLFFITVDAEGGRRIMPQHIMLHRERRCAPFV